MASLMVVDTPGFLSPRHQKRERAATFEEFCHNYGQERLQGLFYKTTLESEVARYREVRCQLCAQEGLPDWGSGISCRVPDPPCSEASWTLASLLAVGLRTTLGKGQGDGWGSGL